MDDFGSDSRTVEIKQGEATIMVSFYDLFVSFMFIGLVTVGLFTFGIGFQNDNDVSDKFNQNTIINNSFSDLQSQLGGLRDQGQAQKSLFESENPTSGFGTILLFSIVSSGKVFNSMVVGVFNTLITLPAVILGVDPIIISVISTLLLITIIIGLWIVYKLGG